MKSIAKPGLAHGNMLLHPDLGRKALGARGGKEKPLPSFETELNRASDLRTSPNEEDTPKAFGEKKYISRVRRLEPQFGTGVDSAQLGMFPLVMTMGPQPTIKPLPGTGIPANTATTDDNDRNYSSAISGGIPEVPPEGQPQERVQMADLSTEPSATEPARKQTAGRVELCRAHENAGPQAASSSQSDRTGTAEENTEARWRVDSPIAANDELRFPVGQPASESRATLAPLPASIAPTSATPIGKNDITYIRLPRSVPVTALSTSDPFVAADRKYMVIRLHPEELGEIQVSLKRSGNHLSVALRAAEPSAFDLLQRDSGLLEDVLKLLAQDTDVTSLAVSISPPASAPAETVAAPPHEWTVSADSYGDRSGSRQFDQSQMSSRRKDSGAKVPRDRTTEVEKTADIRLGRGGIIVV